MKKSDDYPYFDLIFNHNIGWRRSHAWKATFVKDILLEEGSRNWLKLDYFYYKNGEYSQVFVTCNIATDSRKHLSDGIRLLRRRIKDYLIKERS